MGERLEVLMLVLVVDGFQIVGHFGTNRGPGFESVVFRRISRCLDRIGSNGRHNQDAGQKAGADQFIGYAHVQLLRSGNLLRIYQAMGHRSIQQFVWV